jgi:hypothetical protein
MRAFGNFFVPIIIAALYCFGASPASAQTGNLFHAWVSVISGTDDPTCGVDPSVPCKTVNGALARIRPGGEIQCLDVMNNFFPPITKSVTITCDLARTSNSTVGGGYSVMGINVAATDVVILRGFNFDGSQAGIFAGLTFSGPGTLILDNCKITGFTTGVLFQPNGPAKLVVSNCIFADNGVGSTGAGIRVFPQPGGTAQVELDHVTVSSNVYGIAADGSNSTGGINMTVSDSVLSANTNDGLVATTSAGGAPIGVTVTNTKSTNNGFGLRALGANVTVRAESSKIIGNSTGLSFFSGALLSAGNNVVETNGVNGAFSGPLTLK